MLASGLTAAEPPHASGAGPAPYLRLRETTLGYHGPSEDLTGLTEIRIGWFGPSALNDPLMGDLWWAANLAIDEANATADSAASPPSEAPVPDGLSALPFRFVPRWSTDVWGTGVSQLTRMVYDEQPLALIGSIDSAATHLAEQVVAKAQLPLVSPIVTDPSVTLAGVPWMFSCAPSDAAVARVLVDAVLTELGGLKLSTSRAGAPLAGARASQAKPLQPTPGRPPNDDDAPGQTTPAQDLLPPFVLLTTTDHESRMTAREVHRELSRRGRLPDFRFDVPSGAADFSRQIRAVAEANPAVVVVVAGTEDSARLVRAVRDTLGPVPIFGSHVLGRARFVELAGPAAEGVRFPMLFVPDPTNATADRFVARFTAERGHAPDYTAALTFDATRLLVEAIRRAGPNRARIRAALSQLSPWSGVAGAIEFDGTGQNRRSEIPLGTIRAGASMPVPAQSDSP